MQKFKKALELMEKLRGKQGSAQQSENTEVMKGIYDGNPHGRNGQAGKSTETIGDDGEASAGARAAIARDEPLVREVLRLVGVDYDALIAMDGVSPYSLAVASNPALIQDILMDERPVLAAVKVALGFKPQAEFAAKYGTTPEDIKKNIRDEVVADLQGDKVDAHPVAKAAMGPLFSSRTGRGPVTPKKATDLRGVFGK